MKFEMREPQDPVARYVEDPSLAIPAIVHDLAEQENVAGDQTGEWMARASTLLTSLTQSRQGPDIRAALVVFGRQIVQANEGEPTPPAAPGAHFDPAKFRGQE
jgi:hypothetical protein